MRRTITITITEPQFKALAWAIALAEADSEGQTLSPDKVGTLTALDNVWLKIVRAWHGRKTT